MPQNIAVRHRICTDISIKIKDLGFLGECGYNQLLYPVEHQTRDLLKWLMEKIPRTAEEGTEELVGANALMNRNITKSLQQWQKSLWKAPFCQAGKPLRNVYYRTPFGSSSASNFATALMNRHASEKVADARRAEEVNKKFLQNKSGATADTGVEDIASGSALSQKVLASLKAVDKKRGALSGQGTEAGASSSAGIIAGADGKTAAQMNLTLQELISNIEEAGEKGAPCSCVVVTNVDLLCFLHFYRDQDTTKTMTRVDRLVSLMQRCSHRRPMMMLLVSLDLLLLRWQPLLDSPELPKMLRMPLHSLPPSLRCPHKNVVRRWKLRSRSVKPSCRL